MSRASTEKVICPQCGIESDFTIWGSLNTTLNPEENEKLLSGELFIFTCPHCGKKTNTDYAILYHQMEEKRMIYYVPRDENLPEVLNMFRGDPDAKYVRSDINLFAAMGDYTYRIVRTQRRLIEKARILNDGWDDRIIELSKILVSLKIIKEQQNIESLELFYDGGKENVCFGIIDREGEYGKVEIPKEMYDSIEENIAKGLPPINSKDHIIIDHEWAMSFLCDAQRE